MSRVNCGVMSLNCFILTYICIFDQVIDSSAYSHVCDHTVTSPLTMYGDPCKIGFSSYDHCSSEPIDLNDSVPNKPNHGNHKFPA